MFTIPLSYICRLKSITAYGYTFPLTIGALCIIFDGNSCMSMASILYYLSETGII